MKKILGVVLYIVSLAMLSWSGYQTGKLLGEYRNGQDSYASANQTYVTKTVDTAEQPEPTGVQKPAKNPEAKKKVNKWKAPITVDFVKLQSRNPDVVGWIYIESIDISYPVLQGGDNEYYLTHTWDHKDIFSASIFMDYRNYPDFEDYNTVIYGHNMKDGSMFHKIQYCMEKSYYEKSPYIWILTPGEDLKYEIFSEYDTRYDSDTYTLFDGPGESLKEYIKKMKGQSLWENDVELGASEHILTLSTCNGEHELRRIVQAKRLEPPEN